MTRRESGRPSRRRHSTLGGSSSPELRFPFFERSGPVGLEEARERAIGEHAATRLAGGAVVRLVVGVADALDGRAADGAGLPVAAVHGHALLERAHLLGKLGAAVRLGAQLLDPEAYGLLRCLIQARDLSVAQFSGELKQRKLRGVQNLIR